MDKYLAHNALSFKTEDKKVTYAAALLDGELA